MDEQAISSEDIRKLFRILLNPFREVLPPDRRLYQQQRRHGNGLAVENGRNYLAAVPLDFLLVVGHALPGRQHVVDNDDFFPFNIPDDVVVPFEDTVLRSLGFVQALARLEHVHVVQPRGQIRPVRADIPVEPLETLPVFYPVAAWHEHDMVRLLFQLQGGHAGLEELDAVYLAILEPVKRTAERTLLIVKQGRCTATGNNVRKRPSGYRAT